MAPRRDFLPLNPVTPIPVTIWDGSKSTLAGSATWTSNIWQVGQAYMPEATITDANADVEYMAAGWFCDVYWFADKPGQVEFMGAATQITGTTYRMLEDPVIVHSNVAGSIKGYRIPCPFFYVIFRNGAAAQGVMEFIVSVKGI